MDIKNRFVMKKKKIDQFKDSKVQGAKSESLEQVPFHEVFIGWEGPKI